MLFLCAFYFSVLEIRVNARRPPTHRDRYYSVGAALISANRKIGNRVHNWILLIQLPTRAVREKTTCQPEQSLNVLWNSTSLFLPPAALLVSKLLEQQQYLYSERLIPERCSRVVSRFQCDTKCACGRSSRSRSRAAVKNISAWSKPWFSSVPLADRLLLLRSLFLKFDANYSESLTVGGWHRILYLPRAGACKTQGGESGVNAAVCMSGCLDACCR